MGTAGQGCACERHRSGREDGGGERANELRAVVTSGGGAHEPLGNRRCRSPRGTHGLMIAVGFRAFSVYFGWMTGDHTSLNDLGLYEVDAVRARELALGKLGRPGPARP
jgi:hypothetical protein